MRALAPLASLAAAIGLAASLAACGSSTPKQPPVTFSAALNGGQEVPPTGSTGVGKGSFVLHRGTLRLDWHITYQGLSGPLQAAHLHGPADAGEKAGVQVPIPVGESPLVGSATLTRQQADELIGGRLYVNLHTAAHPDGEIRGQILPGALVAPPAPAAAPDLGPARAPAGEGGFLGGTPFLGPRLSPEVQPLPAPAMPPTPAVPPSGNPG